MNDCEEIKSSDFGFDTAAIYKIKVIGKIPTNRSDCFSGMSLHYFDCDENTISILRGVLPDQAALSGVLNALYDMHFSVLSVKKIENPIK